MSYFWYSDVGAIFVSHQADLLCICSCCSLHLVSKRDSPKEIQNVAYSLLAANCPWLYKLRSDQTCCSVTWGNHLSHGNWWSCEYCTLYREYKCTILWSHLHYKISTWGLYWYTSSSCGEIAQTWLPHPLNWVTWSDPETELMQF